MNEIELLNASSQYFATLLRRWPELADWLWQQKNLYRRYPLTEIYEDLQRAVSGADSFEQLQASFRRFKQRHFLRIGGRDLLGWANLAETTGQLSDLAAVALQVGMNILSDRPEWFLGRAKGNDWRRVRESSELVVMGLGKLGGHELNYVSDVDLLFLHRVKDQGAFDVSDSLVWLNRFCQRLSELLSEKIEGDRVFEVDHRLRPLGKDGPLVPSVASAVEHYLLHGQPWERQMLLKARPVAGDRHLGSAFIQEIRPFLFRRFLDFQALDELREMRDRILAEAVRPSPGWQGFDVKLGMGGIREIEFLTQSLQLIYGGRHPELEEPNTLACLRRLQDLGLLTGAVVQELSEAYVFLRRVEHWVQLDQNRQTQKLPQSTEARSRLVRAMGFDVSESLFLDKLAAYSSGVHRHFVALFESRKDAREDDASGPAREGAEGALVLDSYSAELMSSLQNRLESFPQSLRKTVSEVVRELARAPGPLPAQKALTRLDRYFTQVGRRPGLVRVFSTDASWLGAFLRGLVRSELLADLLIHHPGLVEGFATASGKHSAAASWERVSTSLLSRNQNYEEGLEWLRRLKNERILQLALADLDGSIDHRDLEEELSFLADFVIRGTYQRVLASRGLSPDIPLAVFALGKLGSREMSYLSDLDLVFVYKPSSGAADDHIPGEIVNLTQRFMRMLSTPLNEGPGYPVDARLRPTGNYGTLIVTWRAWQEYYRERADLWEIQALLRLRAVAGSRQLGELVESAARNLCYRRREPAAVWQRLCHLRQRMQRERSEEREDTIDLKLGAGGLADLEFLVQGCLLVEGYRDSSLQTGSVRAALGGVLQQLSDLALPLRELPRAFAALRSLEHRLALYQNLSASRLRPEQFDSLKAVSLWPPNHSDSAVETWQDLLRLRRRVRSVLQHWCPNL